MRLTVRAALGLRGAHQRRELGVAARSRSVTPSALTPGASAGSSATRLDAPAVDVDARPVAAQRFPVVRRAHEHGDGIRLRRPAHSKNAAQRRMARTRLSTPQEAAMTLCQADRSTLLIIDPQARLMPAIHDGDGVVRRCVQLATAARELGIPVIGTEENPDGLGPQRCRGAHALRPRRSPSSSSPRSRSRASSNSLPAGRETLVVAGCEAHVCVMQTVARPARGRPPVKWVSDAVGSRTRSIAMPRPTAHALSAPTS